MNEEIDRSLLVPETSSFGFPFEPYPIQFEFMRGLYSTLQQRKHGIFESPTGTVNSLSNRIEAADLPSSNFPGQKFEFNLRITSMAIRRDSIVER
jgi:hypothetical protein